VIAESKKSNTSKVNPVGRQNPAGFLRFKGAIES
jgi:hypothetical protein